MATTSGSRSTVLPPAISAANEGGNDVPAPAPRARRPRRPRDQDEDIAPAAALSGFRFGSTTVTPSVSWNLFSFSAPLKK